LDPSIKKRHHSEIFKNLNLESGALEAGEVASLLCKEGLYTEACSLLTTNGIPVILPVKLLARSYSCQISRPDGEDLQHKLEGLTKKLKKSPETFRLKVIV